LKSPVLHVAHVRSLASVATLLTRRPAVHAALTGRHVEPSLLGE